MCVCVCVCVRVCVCVSQRSVEIGNELPGLKVTTLFVGGLLGEGNHVTQGFTGCIQVRCVSVCACVFVSACVRVS